MTARFQVFGGRSREGVVHPPSGAPVPIGRTTDAGARGPMIADVRTADRACAIVAAVSHAPAGSRGVCIFHRADAFGRVAGHRARVCERWPLGVQNGCATGVANAAEIAEPEGVTAPCVGPDGPCAGMGAMGDPGAAHVRDAVASVREAAAAERATFRRRSKPMPSAISRTAPVVAAGAGFGSLVARTPS